MTNLIQAENKIEKNQNAEKFDENRFKKFSSFKLKWKGYDITQKVAIILFWLMSPIVLYWLPYNIFMELAIRNNPAALFFGIFDRFTFLSNYLGCFVLLLYAINPNHHWFRGNRLLLLNASYLLFTFVGYNTVLYDGYVTDVENIGKATEGAAIFQAYNSFIQNLFVHAINPLVAIGFFLFVVWKGEYQITNQWIKESLLMMIFPTAYALYLISVPYTNWQTNDEFEFVVINPTQTQIDNGDVEAYSVYGNPTNTKDYPTAWAYIIGFYLAFHLWTIGLYFLMKLIYKKTNKTNLIVNKK